MYYLVKVWRETTGNGEGDSARVERDELPTASETVSIWEDMRLDSNVKVKLLSTPQRVRRAL